MSEDQPQAGPSGLQSTRRPKSTSKSTKSSTSSSTASTRKRCNLDAETVVSRLFDSDSEDDFDIDHRSDDSGSSEEEEDMTLNFEDFEEDSKGYTFIVEGREDLRIRDDPVFTTRKKSNVPTTVDKPIDFFQLYFDQGIMETILKETNRYGAELIAKNATYLTTFPDSRYHQWPAEGITMSQLKKYIGLLLNMGINKKSGPVADYWTTRRSQQTPFYNETMSVNLFLLIHRMLHLNDASKEKKRGEEGFDPWIKVRCLLDKVNTNSRVLYSASQHLSIDESMIGMKNRVTYLQYMPNKRHARFGLKKFELCDDNGFILHIEIYAGKDIDLHDDGGDGQAVAVVKRLLKEARVLNKGYKIYTDNFYTKPALADFLLEKKTMLIGTVRANSKDIPDAAKCQLDVGKMRFWRRGELLFCAFREKKSQRKPVLLLSTAHNATEVVVRKRDKEVRKPSVVTDYNAHMGGIDVSDKMLCHYASERATRRYWKKVFQNLLDISILNSWILHNLSDHTESLKRGKFLMDVVESLCEVPTVTKTVVEHHLILLEGRKEKDCVVCSKRSTNPMSSAGRKRTRHWCPACQVGCHEQCEPQLNHETGRGQKKTRSVRSEN